MAQANVLFRIGPDLVHGEVGAAPFVLWRESETEQHIDTAINQVAGKGTEAGAEQAAEQLREEADTTHAAQCLQPEDTAGDTSPQSTQSVQRPHAEDVVELIFADAGDLKRVNEDQTGNAADDQRADRVHDV